MKKILKILAITIAVIVVILLIAPFLFEGKIIKIVKQTVNENINAQFEFKDADISLLRDFPNVSVGVEELSLINNAPFEGDTLVYAQSAALSVPFMQLFNSAGEAYSINSFEIDGAVVNILTDKDGNVNYDIAKESTEPATQSSSGEEPTDAPQSGDVLSFSVERYEITNSKIKYYDQAGKMYFELDEFNHSGNGDLSASVSELDTQTSTLVSFEMDSVNYLDKNPVKLDALIGVDLDQNKYTFLDNKALINQLELVFDGFVQVNDNSQEVDITFKTPSTDFKNFLAVIPKEYSKDISNVETSGDFAIQGVVKGIVDDKHIPSFDIDITSNNASFKYPDLPQAVKNINIDTRIANETGLVENTFVDIKALDFQIAQDVFSAKAQIKNIMDNPLVNAKLKGRINLANLSNAYPFDMEAPLKGILDADLSTNFDMNSIERNAYQNTKNSGTLSLKGFEYSSEDFKNPILIDKADIAFNGGNVDLNSFVAKTGQTDLSAKGTIENLLGYMFNKETLKGNFDLNSNTFAINDFMMASTEDQESEAESQSKTDNPDQQKTEQPTPTSAEEEIKIPAFLDATISAKANKVIYDNLTLNQVSGTMIIKDETVTLKDITSSIFGGSLALNGSVSTKQAQPTFNLDLGMNNFSIAESFEGLEMLQAVAPIADALMGTLNTSFDIKGNLNSDFTPNLLSISGNALAEALISGVDPEKGKLLSVLNQKVDFLQATEENVKDIKANLSFDNGKVNVKPFNFQFKDIAVEVAGSHGFDKSMAYDVTFDVPAKYLGEDVTKVLTQLNDPEAENIAVPVTATIGGSYTNPSISTNLGSTVSTLTKQLVERQKQKLIGKGTEKLEDALGDLLGGNKTKDSTATASKDSVQTDKNEQLKNTAGKLIKGLFGNKEKDTVN
jgi:hypothetical protein